MNNNSKGLFIRYSNKYSIHDASCLRWYQLSPAMHTRLDSTAAGLISQSQFNSALSRYRHQCTVSQEGDTIRALTKEHPVERSASSPATIEEKIPFIDKPGKAATPEELKRLELRGLSVLYLNTGFVEAVERAGPYPRHKCTEDGGSFCGKSAKACGAGCVLVHGKEAKIYEIEPDVIRVTGERTVCPRDGRIGAAYVDAIDDSAVDHSSCMLSYTWYYKYTSLYSHTSLRIVRGDVYVSERGEMRVAYCTLLALSFFGTDCLITKVTGTDAGAIPSGILSTLWWPMVTERRRIPHRYMSGSAVFVSIVSAIHPYRTVYVVMCANIRRAM